MTPQERKTTFYLASIYSFRMLGLFMILPIFSLYTNQFQYATTTLVGFALGIYGLTQALLQIPFGMLSDRIGRKPVITVGLILFAFGSIIAAESHSIYSIIFGRALQGAGAIGSTLTALIADSTQEENRLKAMTIIGMTIGLSFIAAMILGPLLNSLIGLAGIFWLTALLACLGIVILFTAIPTPKNHLLHRDSEAVLNQFKKILTNTELLRLDFGIFTLHTLLTASFIAIPIILLHNVHLPEQQQWILYLPVLALAFIAMLPFIFIAEAKRQMKLIFVGAVILLTLTQFLLGFLPHHLTPISILLFLFFTAFTLLEASLPSLVSKIAPAGSKGTAMGIYSSSQFFGIFVGGTVGGFLLHHLGLNCLFLFCGIIGVLWSYFAITMQQPLFLSSKIISIGTLTPEEAKALATNLLHINGIKEAKVYPDEQVAYLKIDKKLFSADALTALLTTTLSHNHRNN